MSHTMYTDTGIVDSMDTIPDVRCPLHPDAGLVDNRGHEGSYVCRECGTSYKKRDGIDRVVTDSTWRRHDFRAEAELWDQEADVYDARRTCDPRYMAGVEAAVKKLAAQPGDTILDTAFGTGLTTRRLVAAGCRVAALDMSVESLSRLRGRVGAVEARLVQGDLTALPFASGSFDRVLCANALQQLKGNDRRQACIRELVRVLRPGGRIVLTAQQYSVPRRRAGWVKEGPTGNRVRYVFRFTSDELRQLLAGHVSDLRIRGAGFPLPHRYKLGVVSRVAEHFCQRVPVVTGWADLLVATGMKPFVHSNYTRRGT